MNSPVERALETASRITGQPIREIIGQRRFKTIMRARRLAAKILRSEGLSYHEIGQALGGRNHATAMALCGGALKR